MVIRARKQVGRPIADSRVPRYLQVASVLRRRIRDGHWSVGEKIATLDIPVSIDTTKSAVAARAKPPS